MTSFPPPPPSSTPPKPAANPFASSSGSRPSAPPPPGGLLSRLGARATLDYVAMHDTLIMFDLDDAAGAIFDLLQIEPTKADEQTTATRPGVTLINMMEKNRSLPESLKPTLNEYWHGVSLVGAVHVYDWREEVKEAAVRRLNAIKAPPDYLRATDPFLIVNVLARSRTNLLIPGAALALDRPFLQRIVITDDPRLTQYGASAYMQASLVPPPPPDDLFDDDDEDDDTDMT